MKFRSVSSKNLKGFARTLMGLLCISMHEIYALVAGTLYGLLIGIIPSVGATTGLVALFGFISYFVDQPYLGVIFCMDRCRSIYNR